MSVAGKINMEIYEGGVESRKLSTFFVSLHTFLSSTCAPLGVVRRACNFGTAGTGMGYWDQANPVGESGWATFEFTKANPPVWVNIQWNTGAPSAGSQPYVTAMQNEKVVGISVATRADGLSPWNGTTGNTGSDTRGTPVWTDGGVSRLYVFPRSNNPIGSHNTSKQNAITMYGEYGTYYYLFFDTSISDFANFFATEDSLFVVYDQGEQASCYYHYFGKYVPIPDLTPEAPYFYMSYQGRNGSQLSTWGGWYYEATGAETNVGSFNGSTAEAGSQDLISWGGTEQGGCASPMTASVSLVRRYVITFSHLIGACYGVAPNMGVGSGSFIYDEHPFHLFLNEGPATTGSLGYVGTSGDLKFMVRPDHGAISRDGTKACFRVYPRGGYGAGTVPYADYFCPSIVTPWTSSVKPYLDMRREGYDFVVT